MAAPNSTVVSPAEWTALLDRFSQGIALVALTCRSLMQQEMASQEQEGLHAAIGALETAYQDLDLVIIRLQRVAP